MALIDKASLLFVPSVVAEGKAFNILPSGNRAPDSTDQNSGYDQTRADFDFDRGSNAAATRVNASGLIEKYRENTLLNSNQFDTTWQTSGTTPLSGYADRNGGTDAWLLREDATTSNHWIRQSSGLYSGIGTFSFYAKKKDYDYIQFARSGDGGDYANFNISNGTLGNVSGASIIDRKIESVGNGWYRCSVTYIFGSNSFVGIALIRSDVSTRYESYLGNGTSGTYIQDAQVETGLVASSYLDSTSVTAKAGVLVDLPRINYDANGENGALLLEPSRQQLVQYSEYFGGWGQINTINTANALTSPEGLQNANKLIAASGVNNNVINQQISAGTYTASVFAKKGEFEGLFIGSGPTGAFFNLNTYAYRTHYQSAPTSHKIEDYGNGWHRYSITFTISGNDSLYIGPNDNVSNTLGVTGNNSNGIYIYGAQLEASASYPSSYIPNHGESGGVTRAADSCSVTGASDVIGQTEGTIFAEFDSSQFLTGSYIGISDGGTSNRQIFGWEAQSGDSGTLRLYGFWNGFAYSSFSKGQKIKVALAYKNNDFALYVNGTQAGTNTGATISGTLSQFAFNSGGGAQNYQGNIDQATLFNERLSNTELATLTTL